MVVLEVREASTPALRAQGAWFGGFEAEALTSEPAGDVAARLAELCALQATVARHARAAAGTAADAALAALAAEAFPQRFGRRRKRLDAEALRKACEGLAEPDKQAWAEAPSLMLAGKPFVPERPLADRAGKNEKSKLKVFVVPGSFDELVSDPIDLAAAGDWLPRLIPLAPAETDAPPSPQKRPRPTDGAGGDGETAKAPRAAPDLSFVLKQALVVPELREEGYEVPADALARLDASEAVQRQLRDTKLLAVLAEVAKAEDRLGALGAQLDRDPSFAAFVDLLLETVGAQKRRTLPDGSTRAESRIVELLGKPSPALPALPSELGEEEEEDEDDEEDEGNNDNNESNDGEAGAAAQAKDARGSSLEADASKADGQADSKQQTKPPPLAS